MSNMKHCRMQNTYADLCDCDENWEETTSENELAYRDKLLSLCRQIIIFWDDEFLVVPKSNITEAKNDLLNFNAEK